MIHAPWPRRLIDQIVKPLVRRAIAVVTRQPIIHLFYPPYIPKVEEPQDRSLDKAFASDVILRERQIIERSRQQRDPSAAENPSAPTENNLIGLAMSGGGIRSATIHLGLIQSLATNNLLKYVDYLSAVSGGSFAAAWLSAWIYRDGFAAVNDQLSRKAGLPEADPIRWLRGHSSYLTPQIGVLSADTWHLISNYVRNLFAFAIIVVLSLEFLIMVPLLAFLVLCRSLSIRLVIDFFAILGGVLCLSSTYCIAFRFLLLPSKSPREHERGALASLVIAALFGVVSLHSFGYYPTWPICVVLVVAGYSIYHTLQDDLNIPLPDNICESLNRRFRRNRVAVPSFLSALLILVVMYHAALTGEVTPTDSLLAHLDRVASRWPVPAAIAGVLLTAVMASMLRQKHLRIILGHLGRRLSIVIKYIVATVLLALFAIYMAFRGARTITELQHSIATLGAWLAFAKLIAFTLPVLIVLLTLATVILVGILGHLIPNFAKREVDQISALLYILAVFWLIVFGTAIFGPFIVRRVVAEVGTPILVVLFFLPIAVLFVFRRRGRIPARRIPGITLAADLIPPVLLLSGVALGLSYGSAVFLWPVEFGELGEYAASVANLSLSRLCVLLGVVATLAQVISSRFNVNELSMFGFYREQLSRCFIAKPYLDVGRKNIPADPETLLTELADADGQHLGPYLLVNACLNLGGAGRLDWQERKAASFLFSPLYCGYEYPDRPLTEDARFSLFAEGYRSTKTSKHGTDPGIRLASAIAISGSAIGSSMGAYTTATSRFVTMLLNLRLGQWFPNPRHYDSWTGDVPVSGLSVLYHEVTGRTKDSSPFVYLTDGGHFDNLGLYELIRRRCRLVLLCDASEDGSNSLESLGRAIQLCRSDFGVEIRLPSLLRKDIKSRDKVTAVHFGSIDYGGEALQQRYGVLAYVNTQLCGQLPIDLVAHKRKHRAFPHDPTLDQWFGERQFESYRTLGEHLGTLVIRQLSQEGADTTRDSVIAQATRSLDALKF